MLYVAIVLVVQFFAGFPQAFAYSGIFVFLYLLVFMDKSRQYLKRRVVDIALFVSIFLLLTAIQLLPLAEVTLQTGRQGVTMEFFTSFSASYKVLPMMLFPNLYNNWTQPFGVWQSGEMSLEVYAGAIVFVPFVYAALFHMKDKKIRVFVVFGILAILYSMAGTIPGLRDIVYRIPILNSFRCATRALFLYEFFAAVVFALVLMKLTDRKEAKRLFLFSLAMLGIAAALVVMAKGIASTAMASEEMRVFYSGMGAFSRPLIFMVCLSAALAAYCYIKFLYRARHGLAVVACALCALNILDISGYKAPPFDQKFDYEEATVSPGFSEIGFIKQIPGSEDYRSIAILQDWADYWDHGGVRTSVGFRNSYNLYHQFQTINSYATFRPAQVVQYLGIEDSQVLFGGNKAVHANNPQLSSASAKYIVDPYRRVTGEDVIVGAGVTVEQVENVNIPANGGAVNVQQWPVSVEKGKYYCVEVELEQGEAWQMLFCDLYGEGYDSPEAEAMFAWTSGTTRYTGAMSTGEASLPEKVYLRLASQSGADIRVKSLVLYEAESVPFDSVYKPLVDNEQTVIYENVNARPVINIARSVEDMERFRAASVNTVSYVENLPYAVEPPGEDVRVGEIVYQNNSVTAKVSSETEVFVNHTQMMYPGWNAYVDGEKVENYLVNGIMQGAYVPAGEHIVEFRFEPKSLYIGAVLTVVGIILLIFLLRREKRLRRSESCDITPK